MTTQYMPGNWPGNEQYIQNNEPRQCNHQLQQIGNYIVNNRLNAQQAQQIYQNIRIVRINGTNLPVMENVDRNRINVETSNGIIIKFTGCY